MFRRAGIDRRDAAQLDDLLEPPPAPDPAATAEGARPVFGTRLLGYDRLQVDNHVARSEWELRSARAHADHLLDRFGACSAELEASRRTAQADAVPERVAEMLQLAAAEAGRMVDAAGEESERLLAEARLEADARLTKVAAIKQMAQTAVDEMGEQARRDRAEAAALLDSARGEATELLRGAQERRDRLETEAATAEERTQTAQAQLAAVRDEVADLQRQRDEARSALRRLTDQIGQVLQAVDPGDLARRTEPGVLTTTS